MERHWIRPVSTSHEESVAPRSHFHAQLGSRAAWCSEGFRAFSSVLRTLEFTVVLERSVCSATQSATGALAKKTHNISAARRSKIIS